MRVRPGDHRRGATTGGAPARPARRWRPATLAAVAAVVILLASGAERDSHPPRGPETAAAITTRPGVEQVEHLGGKLYPPRYDTLDYRLNQLVARDEGRDAAPGTPAMDAGSFINVVVRLDPAYVHEVAAYLREQGVGLAAPRPGAESLAAAVPLSALADLAARRGVHMVMAEPSVQRYDAGVAPHGADFWHDPGWDGGNGNDDDDTNDAGNVKIGILDGGILGYGNGLTAGRVADPKGVHCFLGSDGTTTDSIGNCELLQVLSGSVDQHGTFVAQLLYDIAPGADYYLARIVRASHFEAAITWLIAQDVDVISTSLGKTWEGPGDGTSPYMNAWISQVGRAVDAGIFVAVASGNFDTSSWFGTFRDSDGDDIMDWDETGDECNEVQFDSSIKYNIRVRWEDTWNGANDDLDIYLRRGLSQGTADYMSENVQNGAPQQDPFENIGLEPESSVTYCLVIVRESGVTPEWVQVLIEANGPDGPSMEHWTRGYSLGSPAETTKAGAVTVGAAPVTDTSTIQSTSGRGPLPASSASTVVKPDVVGVDEVPVVTISGTFNIDGTSIATPHVAGLAALVKQRNPDYTPAQIATYLRDNALPRGETAPNNTWGYGLAFLPHIGPAITGKPQLGVTLTANTAGVDDIDGMPASPTFTYQWIRVSSGGTEANISGATSATYTPVQADVGKTLKVQVSFQDDATTANDEEQTSRASLKVVPANRAATGKPTISGTLRVTETVTASTSPIRDVDGLTGATFEYQWVRVDGGTDTDIPGETESSYVLQTADAGKTVKVKVSFTDNNRNAETVVSDASAVVGSAPNRPAQFSAATASREVAENTAAHENIGEPVAATDLDNDPLTYAIRNDSGLFAIVASTGQLRTKGSLDYETRTSHTIVVQVTDNKDIDGVADTVIDDTITVTINVLPVDEPPVITGPQTVDWSENAAGTIATYMARDPEGAATFLGLIDTGDDDSFDFSSGRLSFRSAALPDYEGQQQYQIELGAKTDSAASVFETRYAVTINITAVDEPPGITLASAAGGAVTVSGSAVSVDENHTGDLVDVTATDPESTHTDYTLALGGTHSTSFTLNTGVLSFTNPPDHEAREVYNLTLTASNASETSTLNVTVTVLDVDEPADISFVATGGVTVNGNALTVDENHDGTLATFRADDPENDQTLTYTWSTDPPDHFVIRAGGLSFRNIPDYEDPAGGINVYDITVSALDSDGETGSIAVTVTVEPVDEPPEITLASAAGSDVTVDGSDVTVDENHAGDLVNVTATDPETTHTDYTLALGGTHSTSFTLNSTGATGVLSFTNPPDHEAREVYRLTLTASNAMESSTLNVTVTVGDVDEPADISFVATGGVTVNDNALTVDENHDGTLATFRARDPENDQTLTYTWSTDPPDHFVIRAGVLSFRNIPDYEDPAGATNVYNITVRALDSDGETGSIAVTVTVEPVDEPADISFVATGGVTVNDNALTVDENYDGTLATFIARDPEGAAGLTYQWALEGTDHSHFAITAAGELSFLNIPDYDRPAGGKNVYNITVKATDSAPTPLTGRIAVTVAVLPVNEPPVITGPDEVSIEEGGATFVGTYTVMDPESATIAWLPLDGADKDEFEFTSSNGRLAFKEAPDFEDAERGGDNEYNVTLGVSAGSHTITFDVVVTVTNKEEQGTLLLSSPQPQVEAAFTATLTDPDIVGATTWKWERSMSSGGGWQPIDGATAASYTPVVGDIDYYLHATATYTDGYSANKSLSAVSANRVEAKPLVNTAPEFPPGPTTRSVPEDARANDIVGAPVVAADAEHAGQLTYTLTGGSDLFTIDGGSGQIRVAADESLDHETAPSHSVVVTATDPSLAFDTVQVTIDVTNVNEPPNAVGDSAFTDEDTAVIIRVLNNDSDPEDERSELLLTVVTPPRNGSATVNEPAGQNRTITYEPNANYHGADSFTYQVTDSGGLSSTARVTVQIAAVNDAPEFATDMTTRTVSEGAGPGDTVGTKVAATDVDDSTLTYRLSGASDFVIDASGPTAGQIRVAPGVTLDRENTPSYQVTVTATDRLNASDTIAVTINLDNVNDPPVAESDTATTNEDMSVNIDVLDNDTDPDTDRARLRVSVLTQPLNGTARAQSDQTITYTPNANFAGPNSFTYRLSDGQFTDDGSVSVTVVAVNDAPTFFPTTAARSVPEDAEAGDNVGPAVTATDVEGDTLSY